MSAKKHDRTSIDQSILDSNWLAEGIQFQMGCLNSLSSSTSQDGGCYFFPQKLYLHKLIIGIIQNNHCIKYTRIGVFTGPYSESYTGEYGPVKTRILAYFMQWISQNSQEINRFRVSGNFSSADVYVRISPDDFVCMYLNRSVSS